MEFALSLAVLLLLIFAVVEGGRLLHGWITLQNAAREGGRYAITGGFEQSCLSATPACPDARVWSIEKRVIESSTGLAIDPRAGYDDPRYMGVEVSGVDKDNVWQPDFPGLPGRPVMVRATYLIPLVTPLLRPIAETVRLTGQVVVNNENYAQVNSSRSDIEIGDLPPPPPPTIPVSDLEVKNDSLPLVSLVNESIIYSLQVTNHGPDEARGVEVIDQLPEGVALLSTSPSGICNQAGQTVTCTPPNLPRGVRYGIELTVKAPSETPPAPGVVVNHVSVTGAEADDDLSNNEDTASTLVVVSEDVSDLAIISIDDAPEPVVVNQEVTYTVLVRNNGISDAFDVALTSTLPDGFSFESAAPSNGGTCTDSGEIVVCQIGNIATGEMAWAEVTARAPSSPGSETFVSSVAGSQVDPDERNNTASEVTTISPEWSDLYVAMTDAPDPVLAGSEVSYSITAGNNGPSDATGVIVVDKLPDNLVFISAEAPHGNCEASDQEVVCDLGEILRGQEVNIEVIAATEETGTVTNHAAISSQQTDPNPVNDQVTTVTTVAPSSDLSIAISATPRTPPGVRAGTRLTYRLVVSNDGPSPATHVEVSDKLPMDARFLSVSTTQGTCVHTGATVDCFLGNLAIEDSVDITIETIPEQEGIVINTATVTGRQADPNRSNNTAADTTTVLAASDAFITLDPACGDPGSSLMIRGFNWPSNGNKEVDIYWDVIEQGSLIQTLQDNGSSWLLDLNVPTSAIPGSHTIIADRQGVVAEASYEIPCPAPNLTTTQPELISVAPLAENEPASFQVDVTNNGQLDAVNQFFVGLYFDPPSVSGSSATHIPQSYRVALVAISWMGAGESRKVTITEEDGFGVQGLHDVYIVVDSDPGPTGLIKELSESDNVSPVLQVEVEGGQIPTPTPGPTPTSTPEAIEPGSLIGQAFLSPYGGQPLPQAGVEVTVYDIGSSSLESVGFTDTEGSYFLTDIYPGAKTIVACIIIDDVQYTYTATGVEIVSGQISFKDLFLEEGQCH